MDEPLVRAQCIGRSFGRGSTAVAAVRDATFQIRSGDRIALTGPSGSGKTTLLLLLAGIDAPTSGEITWPALGPANTLRPAAVGFAFQGDSLLPALTVEENIALPLVLTGASEPEALGAAAKLISEFALEEVGSKLPEEISGGQAQRASVARALVVGPQLVLADEPTGQQDRASGSRVMDALIRRVQEAGSALVVATHDPSVAERLSESWSMADGRVRTEAR